ncbi:glutathione S-transferase family protein [Acinetobacter sp. ANC 5378]|uniref:glutathione S-transferase family protein n=1 Tax=Acinetobacter sp. ANC 5378 TaxID=2731249 RepID=UPI00148FC842|nr:glutathione S-transferase family protein [Acinetobacter sp. ANC 5378]NNG82890.1 glutathione S-transferase family protein [Acinetobacter sp. ANC 5378]
MYQLYIANKNYSSWSMRPWLVLKAFNLPFEEIIIPFSSERNTGTFKQDVLAINPNGKVPVLVDEGLMLWDSLAICEYLAEQHPDQALWPEDVRQRARARCISAEMHSGFPSLRNACGMNIRANLADVGKRLWQDNAELRQDVARIEQIWSERPGVNGFLCGAFSIADAFYAPVVTRLMTYALPVSESTRQYMQTMLQHPAMQAWIDGALQEDAWVNYLESYQQKPL